MKEIQEKTSLLREEIEVRVDTCSDKSFTVVCYINPRTAMKKLTELYGENNWSKEIKLLDKKSPDTPFYCVCSIKVTLPDGQEVVREAVGQDEDSPKNAESDALKRAAMNFIPSFQSLYTIPTLRIPVSKLGLDVYGKDTVKKEVRYKKFFVNSIRIADGASGEFVKSITIAEEETGNIVCEYLSTRQSLKKKDSKALTELKDKLALAGISEQDFLSDYKKAFGVNDLEEIASTKNLREHAERRLDSRLSSTQQKQAPAAGKSVNQRLKKE